MTRTLSRSLHSFVCAGVAVATLHLLGLPLAPAYPVATGADTGSMLESALEAAPAAGASACPVIDEVGAATASAAAARMRWLLTLPHFRGKSCSSADCVG